MLCAMAREHGPLQLHYAPSHRMRALLTIGLFTVLFIACGPAKDPASAALRLGAWHAELDITSPDDTIPVRMPFLFDITADGAGALVMVVRNGSERITVPDLHIRADSVHIRMPLYDSEFLCVRHGDSLLTGEWRNHLRGEDYALPFRAIAGDRARFEHQPAPAMDITGEWRTLIYSSCCDPAPALGLFTQQRDGLLTGTFATETGDHRFLEGVVRGDSMLLSVFNGFQANLFVGHWRNDSLVGTAFWGRHGRDRWEAVRDPGYRLRPADSLTFLKEGYDMVALELTDLEGRTVSPQDTAHKGRVVIVQVLGSWCPNCVDESQMLQEFVDKYGDDGLRVIGVAFERHPTAERAVAALERFRDHLGLRYPICYAGSTKKEVVAEKLPFLDRVMSFPTSITIGRDGKVRRIHTGFYGPGTGAHYTAFKQETAQFLQELLAEPLP